MYEVNPQQMHQATCALPEHFRRLQHQHKDLLGLQNRGPLHLPVCKTPAALSWSHFYRVGGKAPGVYERGILNSDLN